MSKIFSKDKVKTNNYFDFGQKIILYKGDLQYTMISNQSVEVGKPIQGMSFKTLIKFVFFLS